MGAFYQYLGGATLIGMGLIYLVGRGPASPPASKIVSSRPSMAAVRSSEPKVPAPAPVAPGACGARVLGLPALAFAALEPSRGFLKALPSDDGFGSHLVPLAAALLLTRGPVLEMGTGLFSTGLVHNASEGLVPFPAKREALSLDTDKAWLGNFTATIDEKAKPHRELATARHRFGFVPVYEDEIGCYGRGKPCKVTPTAWDSFSPPSANWSVVFADHRPGERRKEDLRRLACAAQILIAHDSQQPSYGYAALHPLFRFAYVYQRSPTQTTLYSNYHDLAPLKAFLDQL